jgi:hypothetical protein
VEQAGAYRVPAILRTEQARAGDGGQRPLVPRSHFQPRLTRGARHYTHLGDRAQSSSSCYNALSLVIEPTFESSLCFTLNFGAATRKSPLHSRGG